MSNIYYYVKITKLFLIRCLLLYNGIIIQQVSHANIQRMDGLSLFKGDMKQIIDSEIPTFTKVKYMVYLSKPWIKATNIVIYGNHFPPKFVSVPRLLVKVSFGICLEFAQITFL